MAANFDEQFALGLRHAIPIDEASAYFLRLKGQTKEASAEEMWDRLTPEQQDEILKLAEAEGFLEKEATAPMPPSAMGQTMAPPAAATLPPTAMGQNAVKAAEAKTPKEKARDAAETDFEKKKFHKGERTGELVGRVAGAAAGAGAGHHFGKGNIVGSIGGLLAGSSLGGKIGKHVGAKSDEKRFEKKAFDQPMSPEGEVGNQPDIHQYLAAEEMGQQAQEQNSAAYYQQKFQEAAAQLQQTQAQATDTQTLADTLQQQVAGSQEQIQAAMQQAQLASQAAMQNVQQAHEMAMGATAQAMESQQEVLRQKQLAAAMKMGITQVKDQVMSALASDPTDQLAQQLTAPPPGSGGMVGGQPAAPGQDPNAQPGMTNGAQQAAAGGDPSQAAGGGPGAPGQEAGAGTPPNSAGAGEDGEAASDGKSEKSEGSGSSSSAKGSTKVEIKQASFPLSLPGALTGAALGGLAGAGYSKMSNEPLRQKVKGLEGQEGRSFSQSMDLAQSKARLAFGEAAEQHPVATSAMSAGAGALVGGKAGPGMVDDVKAMGQNLRGAFENLKKAG